MARVIDFEERTRVRRPAVITIDELDELHIELATSKIERLAHSDAVRDLVQLALSVLPRNSLAAHYLRRLERRNEREAVRARSIDSRWVCACGPADSAALEAVA